MTIIKTWPKKSNYQRNNQNPPTTTIKTLSVLLIASLLLSGCSKVEWCESNSAKMLRERPLTTPVYPTIHELIKAGPESSAAIFAHRGGYKCDEMDEAPENSLANLETAIGMGFDGYETDLWMAKDGSFLIHHDLTLDRTTTGTGEITSISLEDARKLSLKYDSGKISTEKLSTFGELLVKASGRILLLVELKGESPKYLPELINILQQTNSADKVLFWVDWNKEYVNLYEQYLKSGINEVKTNVLWRARNAEQFKYIVEKLDPIMIDFPLTGEEIGENFSFFGSLPERHLALVDSANKKGIKVLVSKLMTNSYLDVLLGKDVRMFMSRDPEVQLTHLIKNESHY